MTPRVSGLMSPGSGGPPPHRITCARVVSGRPPVAVRAKRGGSWPLALVVGVAVSVAGGAGAGTADV